MKSASKPWEIVTRRGRGPVMHFDGRKFTNDGNTPSKTFNFSAGSAKARALLQRYEVLTEKGYHIWLRKVDWAKRPRRKNPDGGGIEQAAHRLQDFTGFAADKVATVQQPTVKEGLVIGDLDLIGYRTKRLGVESGRVVKYGHKFSKSSRPLLAVSKDGKQLLIVGGRYEFTEAGIENR